MRSARRDLRMSFDFKFEVAVFCFLVLMAKGECKTKDSNFLFYSLLFRPFFFYSPVSSCSAKRILSLICLQLLNDILPFAFVSRQYERLCWGLKIFLFKMTTFNSVLRDYKQPPNNTWLDSYGTYSMVLGIRKILIKKGKSTIHRKRESNYTREREKSFIKVRCRSLGFVLSLRRHH